jgi:hypothetical protein
MVGQEITMPRAMSKPKVPGPSVQKTSECAFDLLPAAKPTRANRGALPSHVSSEALLRQETEYERRTQRYTRESLKDSGLIETYVYTSEVDEDYLSLRKDIAHVDAHLRRLDALLADAMENTQYATERYINEIGPSTDKEVRDYLKGEVQAARIREHSIWDEMEEVRDRRRKLVESESRRIITMAKTMSLDDVKNLIRNIKTIIYRYIPDKETRKNVGTEIEAMISRTSVDAAYKMRGDIVVSSSETI